MKYIKDTVTLIVEDDGKIVGMYRQNGSLKVYKAEELSAAGLDELLGADLPPQL